MWDNFHYMDMVVILIWRSCRVGYLLFHQLCVSMGHHMRGGTIAPGWGSANLMLFTHYQLKLGYSS